MRRRLKPIAVRIVLAEPERLVREGLRRILGEQRGLQVVGEAEDGSTLVSLVAERRPDVVLLEGTLPGLSAADAIASVRRSAPRTRCLVVSAHRSPLHVDAALRAGASGYVPKCASPEELVRAIGVVYEGGRYRSPHLRAGRPRSGRGSEPASKLARLTAREQQVLRLIAEGLSAREVAERLEMSPKTAESHRAHLMDKLGIHKTAALVRFAIREGLVSP